MTTSPYHLADDVFLCLSGNRIVFLDLRRNQYLCLNRRNTQTAIDLFTGSTEPDATPLREERATDSEDTRLVAQALADRGLLAQDDRSGKEGVSVRIQTPENVLLLEGCRPKPTVRLHHWTVCFRSLLKASGKLRWYSMQRTVRSVENQKRRCVKLQITDDDELRELVAIFHHLRPFYVREYLCLFDSLALLEFLAHYHHFPLWVFGVKAEPFGAHCWVQENDCVLNDTVEFVREFTPIMVI
jgi:hypothetical protein